MTMIQLIYTIPIIIMIAAIVRLIKKDLSKRDSLDISLVDMDPDVKILQGSISRGKHKNL
jgi:hypothetical protein